MKINPIYLIDFYKADHISQYPLNTTLVYSNLTARKSRLPTDRMVFFGLQPFIKKYLIEEFNDNFFSQPKDKVLNDYQSFMDSTIGPGLNIDHIGKLHDLQYLPLSIEALREGTICPIQTPCITYWNTHRDFAWLTNYLESLISTEVWKPITSATVARLFYENFVRYYDITGSDKEFIKWAAHDFSFRGMSGVNDGLLSGAAHLTSFTGTDTVPAILFLKEYYNATGLIGGSVRAAEHSCISSGGSEHEYETYDRLIKEVYKDGIFSLVFDSYDFWGGVLNYLPSRKEVIMSRNGKLVIRPDSGPSPSKVICGDSDSEVECEKKGLAECLWEIFGGTLTSKGYKLLDSHIGMIYGDSVTLDEQEKILSGLEKKGFASSNIVLGVGSYTYQYQTRDSLGFAVKATYCEVDGVGRNIFKSPKTGAWKKSMKGLLRVNPDFSVSQEVKWSQEGGELKNVFYNGQLMKEQSLDEIRTLLAKQE